MAQNLDYLGAARVSRIINALQDPRLLPADLVWSRRVPTQNAMDEEITARFTGTIKIADLIADDAKAVTYSMGRFNYETTKIPNIKVGVAINQAALNKMADLARYYPGGIQTVPAGDPNLQMFTNWEQRALDTVDLGVKQRKEQLTVAMLCDGVGFTYDRLGIKLTGATWGMYPDLKITPSVAWSSTSATPITDIQTARRIARVRYGIDLNRVTLSTQALIYAAATTEFQNQAKLFATPYLFGAPAAATPLQSDGYLANLFGRMLSGVPNGGESNGGTGGPVTIEVYDSRYWQQNENGSETSVPFLPITNVLLTDSRNDGNGQVYDFANGMTTESIVASAAPVNVIGGTIPQGFGPVAYATAADANLNPPGLVYWGAARGFPRKWKQQSSAVLSVGSFTDTISTALPAIV